MRSYRNSCHLHVIHEILKVVHVKVEIHVFTYNVENQLANCNESNYHGYLEIITQIRAHNVHKVIS